MDVGGGGGGGGGFESRLAGNGDSPGPDIED